MNEFKIKTGLLLGAAPTQPVVSIKDTSISITTDASSLLATGKAIYDFVESSLSPIETNISNLETSIGNIQSYWTLDGSTLVPTDDSVDVQLSAIQIDTDAGTVTVIDMDVSSATAGTEESYAFNIDGTPIAKIYAQGNGSGGIQESKLLVPVTLETESSVYFTGIKDSTQSKALFYNTTTGEITYSDPSAGANISFGANTQVPYMNGTTDFQYDSSFFRSVNWGSFNNTNIDALNIRYANASKVLILRHDVSTFLSVYPSNGGTVLSTLSGNAGVQIYDSNINYISQNHGFAAKGMSTPVTSFFSLKDSSTDPRLTFVRMQSPEGIDYFKINPDGTVYCASIGAASQAQTLYYNTGTGEITYGDVSTGVAVAWGNITGSISSQTDLWAWLTDLSTNKLSKTGGIIGGNLEITGNLTVDGSLLVVGVETLDVSTVFIRLNTGLTGAPPSGLQSGIIVERGTSEPYIFVFDEDQQTFRIGISQLETSTHYSDASTQAVATREDSPVHNGVAYWDGSIYRFDTSVGFVFNGTNVGIGTDDPLRKLHLQGDNTGSSTYVAYEDINTTNGNGPVISFRMTTTGAGAASFQEVAGYQAAFQEHDHATRRADFQFFASDSGVFKDWYFRGSGLSEMPGDVSIATNLYVNGMGEVQTSKVVYYNTASGLLSYGDPSGGTGGGYWTLDGSTLSPTDPTVDVKLGEIKVGEDAGVVSLVDMSVTSTPTVGTEESYALRIDGSTIAKVWGESSGSGALQKTGFVVETYQYMGDPNTNGSWRFYVNSSGDLVFEKRIAGTWTEKGKFE